MHLYIITDKIYDSFFMKILNYILTLLISTISVATFTSCDNDGYSLDNFTLSLATVNPINDNSNSYYLTLDDGSTLWPAATNVAYTPKANQRVIVNYTLLSDKIGEYDHYAKINGLQEILTKQIIDLTPENNDEVGNDPIKLLDLWTGDNYLNIHFGINIGGLQTHTINLVKNKLGSTEAINQNGEIELELRHNKNGDEEKYVLKNYAAFDLRPLQIAGRDSIKIVIKAVDFDGQTKTYSVTYKYKTDQQDKNKNITDMPDNNQLIR